MASDTNKNALNNLLTILGAVAKSNVDSDDGFDKESQKQLKERDQQYTKLLTHFVNVTKSRNDSKEKYKWHYYKIMMALLIGLCGIAVAVIIVILVKCSAQQIVASIPVLVTAIAGFASAIIAIPLSVTQYLFSTKEDEYITAIISHTQEHDLSSRKILQELDATVEQNDGQDDT